MQLNIKSQRSSIDIPLVAATTLLVLSGLLIIYDATVVTAFRDFGDKLYYFKNQLIWASLGFMALLFFSVFDYHKLLKIAPIFLLASFFLLILVLIPHIGTKVYGARRWITIGGFTAQPSEFAKLAIILYAASIMAKFEKFKINLTDITLVLFLPIFLITFLVLSQPDMGTAAIFIGIILTIYFIGKGPIWHFMLLAPPLVILGIVSVLTHPYRISRITSFFNPTHDPQGASYQIYQILIALSSGGLFGTGLGGSRAKFAFIPEVQSDSIFAVFVEELGFAGAILLICLFIFLVTRAITIARHAPDFGGKILAMGVVGLLSIQSLFNLASVVALVPLTGIPLPFISYGGSSLFVTMSTIGILLNIKRQS